MTEMFFVLTSIFVAYVIYSFVSEQKTKSNPPVSQAKPEKPVVAVKQSTSQPDPKIEKAAKVKPSASAVSKPEPATEPPQTGKPGLKDPKTGEVATTFSNYRFTKRWIKEALVAEGLLDKIYKNDELNADIEAKIKSAVLKLQTIKKYRV